jgi:hypothetical protein
LKSFRRSVENDYPDANILICSYRFADEIKAMLISKGYPDAKIFRATTAMTNFIHPSDFAREHYEGYKWAYHFFNDDISKKIIVDRIRMYLIGTELKKSTNNPEYFETGIIDFHEARYLSTAGPISAIRRKNS